MIVLAQQNRQGFFTSPSMIIPASLGVVVIEALISPTDLIDPTKSFDLYIEISDDGTNWVRECGIGWGGSSNNSIVDPVKNPDGDVNPKLTFDPTQWVGKRVRANVNILVTMNIGCQITAS